ncbi:MAG: acetate--CoA ligase family protein [Candidatus Thorarchaeota archaeon]
MDWKIESLDRLFNPDCIAVIGASERSEKLGAQTLLALHDYDARKYPVNPKHSEIGGVKCFPSVSDIDDQIDLAIIALGPQQVLPALTDCASAGVRGAIIFSAGFKELGPLGEKHQQAVKDIADEARIAVIGPNCLGAGNVNKYLNATFFPHPVPLKKGSVSFVSQSGGVAGIMIYSAFDAGVGVAKFASIGNRVNIDFDDMVQFLSQDDETDVMCLFVEGTEKARQMYEEIGKSTLDKDVIVYKVGTTPAAQAAAQSHTGSFAGRHELYTAAVRQAGGIGVNTITEMIDTAKILTLSKERPKGRRVAIVTHTLGPALIAAQILETRGIQLPPPSRETASAIQDMLAMQVDIPITNPVDLLAQGWAMPEIFGGAFQLIMKEPHFDAVMIVFSPNYQKEIGEGMPIETIIETVSYSGKCVVGVLNAPECRPPGGREMLEANSIAVFSNPERAASALANVLQRTSPGSSKGS